MEYKDYYNILGVERNATEGDIKKSYRKLARQYHPDVSNDPGAEQKFKEVGEAYEVLKDPEKRAAYDQLGGNWKAGQDFRPPPGWDAGFEFRGGSGFGDMGSEPFSDFFESLFGRAQGGRRHGAGMRFRSRGEDHHAKILIDLEDAYSGGTRTITLRSPEVTEDGRVITRNRTLNVRLPKGIKAGQQIRLEGQGSPGKGGGQSGDLYLEVEFNLHHFYRVEGADVYLDLPLAPWEAALGAKVTVPTPSGRVDLKIPANSTQGQKLRLKGRGIPANPSGDLYVALHITLPPADSANAKKLYEQMQRELNYNPRSKLGA